jgi:hypothetical protein
MGIGSIPTGVVVLLVISVAVALASHWWLRGLWRASAVTALVAPAIFFVASTFQAGLPNPLRFLALVYFAGFAFLIAVLVGLAFWAVSRLFAPGTHRPEDPGVGV